MKEINVNRISALSGFAISGYMIVATKQFPKRAVSAARYVNFLAISLALLSFILLLGAIKTNSENEKRVMWIKDIPHFVETTIGLIVYFFLLKWFGFLLPSLLFLLIIGWLLGYHKPVKLIISSIGLLAFIYLVFVKFLSVPIPSGMLGGLL